MGPQGIIVGWVWATVLLATFAGAVTDRAPWWPFLAVLGLTVAVFGWAIVMSGIDERRRKASGP